jgi:sigma-B regulation protein RsbU (phosphoserine phosphatase)
MPSTEILMRDHLLDRRQQLAAVVDLPARTDLVDLLLRVDSALERLGGGEWGTCTTCHDPVESERLLADPLVSVCLDCLSAEQRGTLEHDLATAARIQEALLPPPSLDIPGWEIASTYKPLGPVSGDYMDVVLSESGAGTLVAFGDVSGKGVAAAMVMSNLHALLRSLVRLELPLAELMERANSMLLAATTASCYATLVVAEFGADGLVEAANGGHVPPVVARPAGLETLPVTGTPVGLLPDVGFHTYETRMEAGDTLLLFTDGLSEAPDSAGSEFGRRRIGSIVSHHRGAPASEVLAAILRDLDGFQAGAPRTDDLSLMAIRRL